MKVLIPHREAGPPKQTLATVVSARASQIVVTCVLGVDVGPKQGHFLKEHKPMWEEKTKSSLK